MSRRPAPPAGGWGPRPPAEPPSPPGPLAQLLAHADQLLTAASLGVPAPAPPAEEGGLEDRLLRLHAQESLTGKKFGGVHSGGRTGSTCSRSLAHPSACRFVIAGMSGTRVQLGAATDGTTAVAQEFLQLPQPQRQGLQLKEGGGRRWVRVFGS